MPKKCKSLTLSEKHEVLLCLAAKKSMKKIGKKVGVDVSTISRILKQKDRIEEDLSLLSGVSNSHELI